VNVAATVALPETLRFLTGNPGKLAEMQHALAPLGIQVEQDPRGYPEIQADTLREVAEAGARHLLDSGVKPPFIIEDAGLFVAALRGFPGVYSRHALDTIGCAGILQLMQDVERESRTATFQAHLLYVDGAGTMHGIDGTCKGHITDRAAGRGGFGFDPIFAPEGEHRTFAEMDPDEKGQFSHRGHAIASFAAWLQKQ
jgi:XTP/dITP diphosphohydrolase